MKRISLLTLALATSCIQRYSPDPVKTPQVEKWKTPKEEANAYSDCPEPEQVLAEAQFHPWWKIYRDPKLTELEYQAIKESPKVQAAISRLEQAMAYYGIERSYLFPQINLQVTASRERLSQTQAFSNATQTTTSLTPAGGTVGLGPGSSSSTTAPIDPCVVCPPAPPPMCVCPPPALPQVKKPSPVVTSLGILPVLTYDLDFWGKNWQAMQSAMEQVKAEQQDLQNTLLQLTTAVADSYLQTRTYDRELNILEETLTTRQHSYDLNKSQFSAGIINDLAVEQAMSDLQSVAAEIENTKRLRALEEHRLADLVGMPASLFTLEPNLDLPYLPAIRPGLPSQMLERRPDIRQALALIEAARLNVGVAKTAYFPDFTITLDYGFLSNSASKLFKWKSRTWLAAVEATMPLFTAGLIESTIEQAIAQYKQSVASYLDTVLTAFQQVEDALYSIDATKKQLEHLRLDVAASKKAYDIAEKRYRMGLETYLTVVNTERTLLDAQRVEIQVTRAQYSNTISLINSLGGCWDNEDKEHLSLTNF